MKKLSELTTALNGTMFGLDVDISDICEPAEQKIGKICIIANRKMLSYVSGEASAYVIAESLKGSNIDKPFIVVKDTRESLVTLINTFYPSKNYKPYISPKASLSDSSFIDATAHICEQVIVGAHTRVGQHTVIHPRVFIGDNVTIGKNCIIYPNAVLHDNTIVGDNCIIQSGAVIGSDGFGYIPSEHHTKIPHKGNVVLEDYVEIGCNTTIDKATIGSTVIGAYTKIDNLVQIGHNVRIGKGCLIASQCGISGSTTLGDYVMLGGQVGLADHLDIGSFVHIAAKSGVHRNITTPGNYGGTPCIPAKEWGRQLAVLSNIVELKDRVIELEKK